MSSDHIVCLQETKLCHTDMRAIQMLFPQSIVLGSPAIPTNNGISGGLAVILPTHLYGTAMTWTDILPGYAGVVELSLRHVPLRVVCAYMRPGNEKEILAAAAKFLKSSEPYSGTTVFVGDANALRTHKSFSDVLTQHDLHDVTSVSGYPLKTFVHNKGLSALDFIAVSAQLLDASGWTADAIVRDRSDDCFGHKFLYLTCKPPVRAASATSESYDRLPDRQFQSTQHSCRILPALLAQHVKHDAPPDVQLARLNAFFIAFRTSFPTKHDLSVGFRLRKAKQATLSTFRLEENVLQDALAKTRTAVDLSTFPRTSNKSVIIPRRLRDSLLQTINDCESLQRSLRELDAHRAAMLGAAPSVKHWERLRMLSPKEVGTLCQLSDVDGSMRTDPAELAFVIVQGREFWLSAPDTISQDQMTEICYHVPVRRNEICLSAPDNISHAQKIVECNPPPATTSIHHMPSVASLFSTITCCPNTSPGLDGIPYSAYRAAPEASARILHNVLTSICNGKHTGAPRQLLVWIPKAQAGTRPDNWRPLSMPLVYDRILDKAVFKSAFSWFASVLHPCQSLVDVIKDAQFNFCEAQKLLKKHATQLAATLLVDLSKASERVNLSWLEFLLKWYQAPEWLQCYFTWTWSLRTTTTKISNRLVNSFSPLVGLDMGRACSVLLFCLSIDPLFWRLHSLNLPVQRAYMDDTTLSAPGLRWVEDAQQAFLDFEALGIVVDSHTCCFFLSKSQPKKGHSSWRRAAIDALSTKENFFYSQPRIIVDQKGSVVYLLSSHV